VLGVWRGEDETVPISDLDELLGNLRPTLQPGCWVYCTVPLDADLGDLQPLASFREAEGLSVIVSEAEALARGWPVLFRAAWLTLEVDSALEAVGLTAAVATALTEAGISCNVVAAAHHDHLFVPFEEGERALGVLGNLQSGSGRIGV
jgi:uncharacterized protein